ncbi:MAG: hypothetical protein ACYDBJ_08585 [Aggregatilineales bacterium]
MGSALGWLPIPSWDVLIAKSLWLEAAQANGRPIPKPKYRPAIYQVFA